MLVRMLWGMWPARVVALGMAMLVVLTASFDRLARADGTAEAAGANPWIIDTDMGRDDWLALLLMLGHADADVLAISVMGNGTGRCPQSAMSALAIVALARPGDEAIPVACGDDFPLDGFHAIPPAWRDAADVSMFDGLPEPTARPDPRGAVDLIIETVRAAERPVSLLVLGPLTNMAQAFDKAPDIIPWVREIVMMGGALHVAGNVAQPGDHDFPSDNRAEWNAFLDPLAMALVLDSGVPLRLVPLDATRHVPVDDDLADAILDDLDTPMSRWAREIITPQLDTDVYYFWDPLAASVAVDPATCEDDKARIRVGATMAEVADGGWSYPGTQAGFPAENWRGEPRRHFATADAGALTLDPDDGVSVVVCIKPDVAAFTMGFRNALGAEAD